MISGVEVSLSGVEGNASITIAFQSTTHDYDELLCPISSVGFSYESEFSYDLVDSIIEDLNGHYSEEDEAYLFDVQLVNACLCDHIEPCFLNAVSFCHLRQQKCQQERQQ